MNRMARAILLVLAFGACSEPAKTNVSPTGLPSLEAAWCEKSVDQVLARAESLDLISARIDSAQYKSLDSARAAIQKNNLKAYRPKWHLPESGDLPNGFVYRWISEKDYSRICLAMYDER